MSEAKRKRAGDREAAHVNPRSAARGLSGGGGEDARAAAGSGPGPSPNRQSEIGNRQSAAAQAAGLVLGAQEAGLRDCWRRIHAARLAGCSPLAGGGPLGQGGPAEFGRQTPALQVRGGVAVIDVVGPLSKGEDLYNWFFSTLTYGQLGEQVGQARREARVRSVLLRIDSPGGTVAGVSDLCEAVLACRREKPVVAAISDLGASCAYQVASCATRVFCDRDGWSGSIGVFVVIDDVSRMFQDAGWSVRVFSTERDAYKGAGVTGTAVTTEQADDYQRMVDDLGGEMIRAIYEARPALRTAGMKLPDGRVYLAEDAFSKGLIDAVAPWNEVLEAMQDGDGPADRLVTAAR